LQKRKEPWSYFLLEFPKGEKMEVLLGFLKKRGRGARGMSTKEKEKGGLPPASIKKKIGRAEKSRT